MCACEFSKSSCRLGYVNNYIDYFYYGTPLIGEPIEEDVSKHMIQIPSGLTNMVIN
jgi:hypothetical protein